MKIFISYSRKDEKFARKLATSLSEQEVSLWIDVKDIPAGMKWSSAIQEGLDTCDVLILIVSPDALASTNVEDEWHYFMHKKKPIVPLLWRPVEEMPFQLHRIQYIDFRKDYSSAFKKLWATLQTLIESPLPPLKPIPAKRHFPATLLLAVALLAVFVYFQLKPQNTSNKSRGEAVVFTSYRDGVGTGELYRLDLNSRQLTRLTNNLAQDADPTWSSDGSKIAFASNLDEGIYQIYVMTAEGKNLRQLTDTQAGNYDPAWSPDGKKLAFWSDRDGNAEIYLMNADGSSPANLTQHEAWDWFPAWSPDGKQIIFTSERDGNAEIYLMNVDGSSQMNLSQNPAKDEAPSWSPDGSQILFTSDRDGYSEIYVMDSDGQNQRRLTFNTAQDSKPAWSPDGRQIIFASDRSGNYEIYIMDANGNAQTNVTEQDAIDWEPAWR